MSHSIGTVAPTKIMAGSDPVKKVYVGTTQVWPTVAGLYDVTVEYLPAYEVRFTAKTSYAESVEDAFFFRATPTLTGIDGYTGRTFTKKWSSGTVRTCTVQDYYGGGAGGVMNTITVTVSPKP